MQLIANKLPISILPYLCNHIFQFSVRLTIYSHVSSSVRLYSVLSQCKVMFTLLTFSVYRISMLTFDNEHKTQSAAEADGNVINSAEVFGHKFNFHLVVVLEETLRYHQSDYNSSREGHKQTSIHPIVVEIFQPESN